jgi:uncharacterized protein YbjT (DUF2867 family)
MILVIGATGHIGKDLVSQFLDIDQTICVFARDEKKVANLDARVERAAVNLNDMASLVSAMQGIERMFLVTSETQQDVNVLNAAKQTGVRKIIKLSTLEAVEHKIQMGNWHYEHEELILTSGLEWTFLHPGMFMSN